MVKNVVKKLLSNFYWLLLNYLFLLKKIYASCGLHIKEKMTTKTQKQIEDRIDEKNCGSEMNIHINRFIKELKSLNMRAYDLETVLDSLKEQNTKSRIELIDRLIMFSEFADKLNIRLVLWPKNLVFSFLK